MYIYIYTYMYNMYVYIYIYINVARKVCMCPPGSASRAEPGVRDTADVYRL